MLFSGAGCLVSIATLAVFLVAGFHFQQEANAFSSISHRPSHERLKKSSVFIFTTPNGNRDTSGFLASVAEKMGKIDEARIAFPEYD